MLDPTRVTIDVGRTGLDGDHFKKLLMDKYDIQINKTSRNTVLFMVHIGMSRGMIAHLVKVLTEIAEELDDRLNHASEAAVRLHEGQVRALVDELPPLAVLQPVPSRLQGRRRTARRRKATCGPPSTWPTRTPPASTPGWTASLSQAVAAGRTVVCARFVTPYPPGFPVLVPGQVITTEILDYLLALDVTEIHGYEPDFGLRVFTDAALNARLGVHHRRSRP